jgi:hypothetical protein
MQPETSSVSVPYLGRSTLLASRRRSDAGVQVLEPGPLTTVQDLGGSGQRLGFLSRRSDRFSPCEPSLGNPRRLVLEIAYGGGDRGLALGTWRSAVDMPYGQRQSQPSWASFQVTRSDKVSLDQREGLRAISR